MFNPIQTRTPLHELEKDELVDRIFTFQELISAIEEVIQGPNAKGDPTAQAVQACITDYLHIPPKSRSTIPTDSHSITLGVSQKEPENRNE